MDNPQNEDLVSHSTRIKAESAKAYIENKISRLKAEEYKKRSE